jgi:hypothetical protein
MDGQQNGAIRSPVYGPFEVIGNISDGGQNILSLPFAEVAGCNVLVSLADNFAIQTVQQLPQGLFPGAEVSIWGAVQGYEACLRRVCLHMFSGPMQQLFEYAERWDTILFRAQNMAGGSTQNAGTSPPITQANKFSLKVSIYVSPRSGFASPVGSGPVSAFGKAG